MGTVRLVFTRSHHPGSVLLRAFLWSQWSHCAIVDGGQIIEAAADGGVRVRPLIELTRASSRHVFVAMPARKWVSPTTGLAWRASASAAAGRTLTAGSAAS